jgi:hypothetical protein
VHCIHMYVCMYLCWGSCGEVGECGVRFGFGFGLGGVGYLYYTVPQAP